MRRERRSPRWYAGLDWEWMQRHTVIKTIVEVDGDPVCLAHALNLMADVCVLIWLPRKIGMSARQIADFRRYARALKAVAAITGQPCP